MADDNDERVVLTQEQAEAMLDDRERIHTFRGGSGIMIGADWDRADIIAAIKKYGAELSGPIATRMGHGMLLTDKTGLLFIETQKDGE